MGEDIVLAHAKDFAFEETIRSAAGGRDGLEHGKNYSPGSSMEFVAAGEGMLDYQCYIRLLKQHGYKGTLIMHGLSEAQIPKSRRFLEEMIRNV